MTKIVKGVEKNNFKLDGSTIPRFFWTFIGSPMTGRDMNASVIHDHYCRIQTRTEHDTHRNYLYGMLAENTNPQRARLMYWAVDVGGPNWELDEKTALAGECRIFDKSGNPVCAKIATAESQTTKASYEMKYDTWSPQKQELFRLKYSALVKSVISSEGKSLDWINGNEIGTDLESVFENTEYYKDIFSKNIDEIEVKDLGLLTTLPKTFQFTDKAFEDSTLFPGWNFTEGNPINGLYDIDPIEFREQYNSTIENIIKRPNYLNSDSLLFDQNKNRFVHTTDIISLEAFSKILEVDSDIEVEELTTAQEWEAYKSPTNKPHSVDGNLDLGNVYISKPNEPKVLGQIYNTTNDQSLLLEIQTKDMADFYLEFQ